MTYATEAARDSVALTHCAERSPPRSTRPAPSVQVEADAPDEELDKIKDRADERCPGVYCMRNPIDLRTERAS